ncbi:T3SS effector HopA1 family protein [Thalassiella azotivora]
MTPAPGPGAAATPEPGPPAADPPRPAADDVARRTARQVRVALRLVLADPVARRLAATTPSHPDPDGDLGAWLYGPWWCAARLPGGSVQGDGTAAPGRPVTDGDPEVERGRHERGRRHRAVLEELRRTACSTLTGRLVLATAPGQLVVAPVPGRAGDLDGAGHHPAAGHPTPYPVAPYPVAADAVVGSSRPGRPPRPGDLVDVLSGSAGLHPGGGWWWARTRADGGPSPDEPVDRLYLHVGPDGAGQAAAAVLRSATAAGVDVSLKCPADPDGFGRRDALVVYHPRAGRAQVDALLPGLVEEVGDLLRPGTPPMTRPVGVGAAWAQDPGGGTSYGQLRCAQVATVVGELVRSGVHGCRPHDVADDQLLAAVSRAGLDPTRPHLLGGAP